MQLLFGVSLVFASVLALLVALPRNGQVVRFLRSDFLQSYYVASILGAFVVGSIMIVGSVTAIDVNTGYQ
jgi:hypothetical protein